MSDRTVSIVIPNYNGAGVLPATLAALRAQTRPPDEVVVVDNASADGSGRDAPLHYPGAVLVELDRNYGFAGGVNRGVLAASHPLFCVLNSDARPAPDWLEQLLAAPAPDHVWAWGSVLMGPDGGRVESAGDHWSDEGYAYKLGRDADPGDLAREPYEAFAAPGAAPLFRRDRFAAIGGYCERYFLYYEDVDLAYRALLRGWRALIVPSARVEHDLGATSVRSRTRFYVARNSLWTAVRCVPEPRPGALLWRVRHELKVNRPRRLLPWEIAGRVAALAGLPWALRERRRIQRARTLAPTEVRARLAEPSWRR